MLRVLVFTAPIPYPADIEGQVEQNIAFLPAWLADAIAEYGLELALDLLIDLTKPSTGAYVYEELKGLADGSGPDHKQLERIHLIGELTQGDCSMVRTAGQGAGFSTSSFPMRLPPLTTSQIGAWGKATAGAKTIQLRALDWVRRRGGAWGTLVVRPLECVILCR